MTCSCNNYSLALGARWETVFCFFKLIDQFENEFIEVCVYLKHKVLEFSSPSKPGYIVHDIIMYYNNLVLVLTKLLSFSWYFLSSAGSTCFCGAGLDRPSAGVALPSATCWTDPEAPALVGGVFLVGEALSFFLGAASFCFGNGKIKLFTRMGAHIIFNCSVFGAYWLWHPFCHQTFQISSPLCLQV